MRALGRLRAAQAVETLVNLHSLAAIESIQNILESNAVDVATEVLTKVARLQPFEVSIPWSDPSRSCAGPHGWKSREVDCSLVKQLARQELIRRGLEA